MTAIAFLAERSGGVEFCLLLDYGEYAQLFDFHAFYENSDNYLKPSKQSSIRVQ
ncbi:MAG: hypothetical protein H7X84_04100 [Verrucomicrobia bacterium]|nr:hypothetical protein [Prolixibacteraceae bacterium]